MKKNNLFYIFLNLPKNNILTLVNKNLSSIKCRKRFSYFIHNIRNYKKYKQQWIKQVDQDIVESMYQYLIKFNSRIIYNFIFSICGNDVNKLYLLQKIIGQKEKIELFAYFHDIKKDILGLNTSILSENEKRILISKLDKIYFEQIRNGMILTNNPRIELYLDHLFIKKTEEHIKKYNSYDCSCIGFLFAFKDIIFYF